MLRTATIVYTSGVHGLQSLSRASFLIAVLLGGSYVAGQYITQLDFAKPTVTVQGWAKVAAVPDIAVLSFGVQTGRVRTAQDAMEQLGGKMRAVVDAVRSVGIEEKDVSTQHLRLNPSYDYYNGRRVATGYEASQNLRVKVRDLSVLTAVIDAVVSEGVNQIGGVSFTIDDPDALRAQGRGEAIADAREKAEALAAMLGRELGQLKGYTEGGAGVVSPPVPYARTETLDVGGGPPVPSGEQEISVVVTLTFELQ